jgi:lysophospholipase L1-like esterase
MAAMVLASGAAMTPPAMAQPAGGQPTAAQPTTVPPTTLQPPTVQPPGAESPAGQASPAQRAGAAPATTRPGDSSAAAPAAEPATAPTSRRQSFVVAEGNHRVTVRFVGPVGADLTVKAESRRVVVYRAAARGMDAPQEVQAIVNVRTPDIDGAAKVRLTDREVGSLTWDDRLSLEFFGDVTILAVGVEPAPAVPTIYLAGDSTMVDQANEPWTGWGQMLPLFFKPTVAVANHAESGRSLQSFRGDRRLDKILGTLGAGDYLFVQFGHNDQKESGEGVGPFTSYKQSLEEYVAAARERGATPVLVTSMYRRRFDSAGLLQDSLGDYPAAVRQVAQEQGVPLIDLHAMSGRLFQAMGPQGTQRAFVFYPADTFPNQPEALTDNTHFNAYGGFELARCVVEAIRTSGLPLAGELNHHATPFDPATPDPVESVRVPASAPRELVRPEGS